MYRLTADPGTIELVGQNTSIPVDASNAAYQEFLAWVAEGGVPEPYVPPPVPAPAEVPRWAGRLALKRHTLVDGALTLLPADEASVDNLLGQVLAWRATLAPGELADRVDAALDDAKDWLRDSGTVITIAGILGLSGAHVDALFTWAGEQRV